MLPASLMPLFVTIAVGGQGSQGGPKIQKQVSDAYPANIGQLDHYVVTVWYPIWCHTRFTEREKVPYSKGVKQTPFDHP